MSAYASERNARFAEMDRGRDEDAVQNEPAREREIPVLNATLENLRKAYEQASTDESKAMHELRIAQGRYDDFCYQRARIEQALEAASQH